MTLTLVVSVFIEILMISKERVLIMFGAYIFILVISVIDHKKLGIEGKVVQKKKFK